MQKIFRLLFISYFFATKAKLQELKFEFYQIKFG